MPLLKSLVFQTISFLLFSFQFFVQMPKTVLGLEVASFTELVNGKAGNVSLREKEKIVLWDQFFF
jgi:hypothetical protein